jgi:hypothetical protein
MSAANESADSKRDKPTAVGHQTVSANRRSGATDPAGAPTASTPTTTTTTVAAVVNSLTLTPERVVQVVEGSQKPLYARQLALLLVGNDSSKLLPPLFRDLRVLLQQLRQQRRLYEDYQHRWHPYRPKPADKTPHPNSASQRHPAATASAASASALTPNSQPRPHPPRRPAGGIASPGANTLSAAPQSVTTVELQHAAPLTSALASRSYAEVLRRPTAAQPRPAPLTAAAALPGMPALPHDTAVAAVSLVLPPQPQAQSQSQSQPQPSQPHLQRPPLPQPWLLPPGPNLPRAAARVRQEPPSAAPTPVNSPAPAPPPDAGGGGSGAAAGSDGHAAVGGAVAAALASEPADAEPTLGADLAGAGAPDDVAKGGEEGGGGDVAQDGGSDSASSLEVQLDPSDMGDLAQLQLEHGHASPSLAPSGAPPPPVAPLPAHLAAAAHAAALPEIGPPMAATAAGLAGAAAGLEDVVSDEGFFAGSGSFFGPSPYALQPPPLPQNPPYVVTVIDAVSFPEALRIIQTNCICVRRFIFTAEHLLVQPSSDIDVIDVVQPPVFLAPPQQPDPADAAAAVTAAAQGTESAAAASADELAAGSMAFTATGARGKARPPFRARIPRHHHPLTEGPDPYRPTDLSLSGWAKANDENRQAGDALVAMAMPLTSAFRVLATLVSFAKLNQYLPTTVVNIFSKDPLMHYIPRELLSFGFSVEVIDRV